MSNDATDPVRVHDDAMIAAAALRALSIEPGLPKHNIGVRVEDGWATLEGVVESEEQRQQARRALRHTHGVRGCSNHIVVRHYQHLTRNTPDDAFREEPTSDSRSAT